MSYTDKDIGRAGARDDEVQTVSWSRDRASIKLFVLMSSLINFAFWFVFGWLEKGLSSAFYIALPCLGAFVCSSLALISVAFIYSYKERISAAQMKYGIDSWRINTAIGRLFAYVCCVGIIAREILLFWFGDSNALLHLVFAVGVMLDAQLVSFSRDYIFKRMVIGK